MSADVQRRRHLWRTTALASASLVLLLALACPLGARAAQRGWITPPTLHKHLGPFQLHAVITLDPQCPMASCGTAHLSSSLPPYYVAWIEFIQVDGGNVTVRFYRLIEMALNE